MGWQGGLVDQTCLIDCGFCVLIRSVLTVELPCRPLADKLPLQLCVRDA